MAKPATREFIQMARQAGYQVVETEQLRPNRWLLTLTDEIGSRIAVLVQARPLISSPDVQDLADIVRLRGLDSGILLAYGGNFSAAAQRTQIELSDIRLRLCVTLPPAAKHENVEAQRVGAALKSIS
jgi:hypothetical protein